MGSVGGRIKEIIDRMGWKQREAARECGLSGSTIDWILGHPDRMPKVSTMEKIGKRANVSVAWIQWGRGAITDPYVPPDDVPPEVDESSGDDEGGQIDDPPAPARPLAPSGSRLELIELLSRSVADLSRTGDMAGARIASQALAQLVAEGASARPADAPDSLSQEESGVTKRSA